MYSGRCRNLAPETIEKNLAAGMHFAVRLKIEDHPLRFHDIVRGPVEFAAETVSDPVLVRSRERRVGRRAGLQLRGHDRRRADGDHACDSRGRPHLEYAQAGGHLQGFRLAGAGVRASFHHSGRGPRAAFEAPRSYFHLYFSRRWAICPRHMANYLALLGWGAEDGKTETFTLASWCRRFHWSG